MISNSILQLAQNTLHIFKSQGLTITTAESCTGGLIFSCLTHHAGSSIVMDRGFITYSNQSKTDQLNVSDETLEKFGAVSEATVSEMLLGALKNSNADIAIAVSGVAGPGASKDTATSVQCQQKFKPQGLVYIGVQRVGQSPNILQNHFDGDRQQIREQTVETALRMAQESALSI